MFKEARYLALKDKERMFDVERMRDEVLNTQASKVMDAFNNETRKNEHVGVTEGSIVVSFGAMPMHDTLYDFLRFLGYCINYRLKGDGTDDYNYFIAWR